MKFEAKSEEQIQKENLLVAGEYDFEIVEAKDTQSKKSGADMIALNMKVYRPDSGFVFVRDYLMAAMAFKLVHFAKAAGLTTEYDRGELTAESCMGRCGKVKLAIEEQPGYAPKNVVKDYIVPKPAADGEPIKTTIKKPAPSAVAEDESVPF